MLGYFNCVVVMFLDVQTTLIDPISASDIYCTSHAMMYLAFYSSRLVFFNLMQDSILFLPWMSVDRFL